jgi:signal transduction histidine kinase/ActR/RegA family two-component response regulator
VFALYHPEDVEGLQRARRSSIASGTTMVHEFRWIRPDGEVLWVHVEADPVLDPDGRVVGLFGIIQDVTRSKSAETVLEQRLTDLQAAQNRLEAREQELVARTADLRAARDTAETATRAKSDFLAMMSHEIRTPMTGMVGMIGLLCDTPLSNEQQRLAAIARESARDLLVVVNNILDFSKLEAGKLTAESIGFSLEHLMNGVASLLGPKAREDLPLVIIVSAGMPAWLNGDPNRIRQILLNLTSNAIKFTATGSVRLTAAHRVLTGDLVELRIEVVDSGTGISRDVQDRLFTPFTQADTSVSRKYGGTGLGLAICKQLCMTMGGSIGVESVPGQGSTFWFTVQCERAEAPIASAPPLQPTIEKMGRPLRVLVAEDNPMIGALISKLLSKRGHQSELVCNGKEALAAMQCKSYDVVLMDTQMPEMDGITATKAIRGLSGPACQVPIIALTGNALDGQRESCLAAGMNDYLSKPFEPADFYAAIDRWGAVSSKLSKQTSGP